MVMVMVIDDDDDNWTDHQVESNVHNDVKT